MHASLAGLAPLLLTTFAAAAPQAEGSHRLAWTDFDGDHELDLYVADPEGDRFLRGLGDGQFEPFEGVLSSQRASRAAAWKDLNGDGELDLFLMGRDAAHVLVRHGSTLEEVGALPAGGEAAISLGVLLEVVWMDLDTDGNPDLFLGGSEGARLFRNQGDGVFEALAVALPAGAGSVGAAGVNTTNRLPALPSRASATNDLRPASRELEGSHGAASFDGRRGPRERNQLGLSASSASQMAVGLVQNILALCAKALQDQSTGECLFAFSEPQLGHLYPLTENLFVSSTGSVGVGTINPLSRFHLMNGNFRMDNGNMRLSNGNLRIVDGRLSMGTEGQFDGVDFADGVGVSIYTENEERLRVAPDGRVSIGSDLSLYALHAYGNPLGGTDQDALGGWAYTPGSCAVRGRNLASDFGVGLFGETSGNIQAYGVWGHVTPSSSTSTSWGVRGDSTAAEGGGVRGSDQSNSTNGTGVQGTSANGVGVLGRVTGNFLSAWGVNGICVNAGAGVRGEGFQLTGVCDGVYGSTRSSSGYGVWGRSESQGTGVVGTAALSGFDAILAQGELAVTGAKAFVQPHPTDPELEIRYVCLEGNEAGVYFRGSTEIVNGSAVIEVPDDFSMTSRWLR